MRGGRRWLVGLGVAVAAAGVAVAVLLLHRTPEWTTSSPQALREFEAGMNAEMKLYSKEAIAHFRKAVELDPNFVMARLRLAQLAPGGSREEAIHKLRELLDSVDLQRLTPRERFLIRYLRARVDREPQRAEELLDSYLDRHPKDPFALNLKAGLYWRKGELAKARAMYERLVKVSPNWVVGYNSLGYIAMEQGDFTKAEESFATYKFIAPDQANPLDSLGELYLLTGRYDEAIRELQGAIRIKHDFCASWDHLANAELLKGDTEGARELLRRASAEKPCGEHRLRLFRCSIELYPLAMAHRWRTLLERSGELGCAQDHDIGLDVLIHRAAAMADDPETCRTIESHWRELGDRGEGGELTAVARTVLVHGAGVRAVAAGDLDAARDAFRKTDRALRYRGSGEGLFKLFNQACWAEVEGAMGHTQEEARLVQTIARVNPAMAAAYRSGRFRPFGLSEAPSAH